MRIINKSVEIYCNVSKKQIKSAFTLVELIMVMAIIAIVSVFSFGYFSDFSSRQAINEDLSNINQSIKDLDSKVRDMKIYDYRIIFQTGSLAYITYTNYINQDYKRILDFNNTSLNWILSATWFFMSTWTDFAYVWFADQKNYVDNTMDINGKTTLDLSNLKMLSINSSISGSTVNDIYFNYYSQENSSILTNISTKLILTWINTKKDKTGTYSNLITIDNINNKKFIKDQSGQIVDKEFLFFERVGKEISLEIK